MSAIAQDVPSSSGVWLQSMSASMTATPLNDDADCDVVIIGAGYTGLSAASALRAQGADVVAIDSGLAGSGASGRAAGHLNATIGKDLPTLLRFYGREVGAGLIRLAQQAVEHVESVVAECQIPCDYWPSGNVRAGIHEGQRRQLQAAAEAGKQLGAPVRMLTDAEIRERDLPGYVICGYIDTCGGLLDPAKYLLGLRDSAMAAGVRLFENTAARQIIEYPWGVRVRTGSAEVSARQCLLATNAYGPQLGFLRRRVAPVLVSKFATDPLTAAQRSRVGWPGREGIQTAHKALESYRLTADGRIVGGARYISPTFGYSLSHDGRVRPQARLVKLFRERYPELADVEFDSFWSGPIAMSLNFLPSMGRTGRYGNITYSIGCSGHGIAMSSYLGAQAADLLLHGGRGPAILAERRQIPIPPEPLRWAGVQAIKNTLEIFDRHTDRMASRRKVPQRPVPAAVSRGQH